ncbi:hypothetical protein GCM10011386_32500 [Parapedobacter defluvii]|uniref:Uncharacterized protein n=1 Tax=Parapedobacter defluvii TaxID=2045106 RepID=A0ABQ1MBA9_9SPHI|nr:hypothetical protein [Parapedobacter defluvii]RQP17076.1 MAG: hypothetical protein EAS52_09805 [Parapedobacter sp.]GGC37911.1 hypothetical protein GCM10011386_32500 [Parapedobacter defluvii]
MLTRLLYFLFLIAYINTIFHQDGHVHGDDSCQIIDGTPIVEVILEDVFDIPCSGEENQQEDLQHDDYRPASAKWISISPPKRNNLELSPLPSFDTFNQLVRSGLNSKISCLIGYYTFLFRLKPF